MKRTVYIKKIFFYLSVLSVCVIKYNNSIGQSVSHPYGSFCVGQTNVFTFIGQGTVNYWGVGGGGTIVSNNGNSITVVWNSAVSNTYVDAHYNGCCVASYMNITISASATASVSISASQNNICQGTSVTFTATPVNGGSTPYYYWYVGGSYVSGGTSNIYTTSSLTNGQQVYCTMTSNAPCVNNSPTSNTITMTVNTPQTMSVTISGTTSVCQGSQASFSANVTNGVGNLIYQWKKNGNNVSSDVSGPPPYVLVLNSVSSNDVINCVVSSDGCASPATSNSLTITIVSSQTFSIAPGISNYIYCYGANVTFTANATHSAYNYQWYMNGIAVSGATGSAFSTTATSVAQLKSVTVSASTNATCVNNTTASGDAQTVPFVVNPLVTPTVSFTAPVPVILNNSSTFTATPVNGGTTPTYQWQINGTNVSGATNSSFTTTINSGAQLQTISVVMNSNATCAVNPAISSKTVEIVSSNWENMNYIRTHDVMIKGLDNWTQVDLLAIGDKIQSTTYLDGLGRSIQSVDREINPVPGSPSSWLDLVKHFEYDAAGRTIKDFIPYPTSEYLGKYKPNAATVQPSVYAFFDNEVSSSPTYGKVDFDNSPLNRILKSYAPGTSWAGSNIGVSVAYDFNNAAESVRMFTLAYSSSALPDASQTFFTGKAFKTVSLDERGKMVITYTDFSGNVVLKKVQDKEPGQGLTDQHAGWACTYYVYDDLGSLRYVFTPKAVEYLDNNGWPEITPTLIDELCFKYLYDEKGRLIIKKQPGVGEERMVYDKKDRNVLNQHSNQDKINNTTLTKNQWSFILYDDLNREIATGLLDNDADRATIQGYVNQLSNSVVSVSAFVGNGTYQSINVENPVAGSTSSTNYLTGTTNIIFNSITHYDNYNYTGVKSFNNTYSFAYTPASNNSIEATVKTNRTNNLVTGEKIRILDGDNDLFNDNFLFSSAYYDEEERTIQSLSDNIKTGIDYQTNQYDFSSKPMSSYTSHSPGGSEVYTIISKNEFDKIGRLIKFSKNFNNSFYKSLAEYTYDELGRMKTKRIAPGYTGIPGKSEMETLSYNYNIQGWITGINKDYALSENNYTQWDRFFGMYFTYPNHSTSPQWNGNISSITWKSQGDNTRRKYDFEYDNLDRFKTALFKQKNKPADATWSNAEVDFSTYMEYEDGNGNIKSMKHMGIIPGVNNGVVVDDLRYSYLPTGIGTLNGNKLKQVDDLGSLGSNNGLLGDFKDANTTQDYYYDVNGNLVKDLNKNIKNGSLNGVIYNYLNKPDKIVIEGKSTIEFTYDASGEKLKKKVTYTDGSIRINHYINDFVYEQFIPVGGGGQGDVLQYVLHEEGRLKIITTHTAINAIDFELNSGSFGISNWSTGKQAAFEYFIKDHLGNTRMVLTEEVQKEYYKATVERGTSTASIEEPLFGKVDANGNIPTDNELKATRYLNGGSSPWPGKTDDYTRLTAAELGKDIGPNLILKVMAGDMINTNTNYYYLSNNSTGPGNNPINGLVNSLIGAITSNKANALSKNQYPLINSSVSGNTTLQTFLGGHNTGTGAPKAFINVVFFDEQFKFIDKDAVTPDVGSGFLQVSSVNDANANMVLQKKAPKNGWVFIYLSNESNETVYFDNLNVVIDHGRISEETHYYPYGLKINAISSKAFNKLENKFGYQGDFSEIEEETGWDEFDLRMYDPQIGRWISIDPYDEYVNGYVGMGGNPINLVDEDGGFTGWAGTLIGATVIGAASYWAANKLIDDDNDKRRHFQAELFGLTGAVLGAGVGYAIDMSLFENGLDANGFSKSTTKGFGANFRAFYVGFIGETGKEIFRHESIGAGKVKVTSGSTYAPDVWDWVGDLKDFIINFKLRIKIKINIERGGRAGNFMIIQNSKGYYRTYKTNYNNNSPTSRRVRNFEEERIKNREHRKERKKIKKIKRRSGEKDK